MPKHLREPGSRQGLEDAQDLQRAERQVPSGQMLPHKLCGDRGAGVAGIQRYKDGDYSIDVAHMGVKLELVWL